MRSLFWKVTIISLLLVLTACEVSLKKKYSDKENQSIASAKMGHKELVKKKLPDALKKIKNNAVVKSFNRMERKTIYTYYKDRSNTATLHFAKKHSPIKKYQQKEFSVSKYIPNNVQVIPLPRNLEDKLRPLPVSLLRVQAGVNIMLIKASTREIIDHIKIQK